jgi:hypothetical protein
MRLVRGAHSQTRRCHSSRTRRIMSRQKCPSTQTYILDTTLPYMTNIDQNLSQTNPKPIITSNLALSLPDAIEIDSSWPNEGLPYQCPPAPHLPVRLSVEPALPCMFSTSVHISSAKPAFPVLCRTTRASIVVVSGLGCSMPWVGYHWFR